MIRECVSVSSFGQRAEMIIAVNTSERGRYISLRESLFPELPLAAHYRHHQEARRRLAQRIGWLLPRSCATRRNVCTGIAHGWWCAGCTTAADLSLHGVFLCHYMQILPNALGLHIFFLTWHLAVVLLSRSAYLSVCVCNYRQCGCLGRGHVLCLCFVFTYWSRDRLAHMTLYTGTVSTILVYTRERECSMHHEMNA